MNLNEPGKRFIVKYCRNCERTFEINSYGGRLFVAYYEDMPTYKLERACCPKHDPLDTKKYYEESL